jgi:pimeloyl-ACP methyl ester carboxylesterase
MAEVAAASAERIKLRDGRWLAYTEYGDPTGAPVFYFHGTPGSRLEPHPDADRIAALKVRVIVADRPGYGLSDFQRGRKLLDWPADVAQLADALRLERFAVLGLSGGGPHAMACAYGLTGRVTRAALVSSPSPMDAPGIFEGMAAMNRQSFALDRRLPWPLLRLMYQLQGRAIQRAPEKLVQALHAQMSAPDQQVLDDPGIRQAFVEDIGAAYRAGTRAHAWESRIIARDWGFRPHDIRAETQLWHGETDTLAPVAMGRYLAATIPGCRATFFPTEGHLSTYFNHFEAILAALVA